MTSSLFHIFQLHQISGLGLATYWKLIDHFGSVDTLLEQPFETLQQCLKPELAKGILAIQEQRSNTEKYEHCLDWCEQNHVQLISHEDSSYPPLLQEISRRPPLLYVKGSLNSLHTKQVAIVGARSCSEIGKLNAVALARGLGEFGFTITSGLALGVDACAHRGALEAKAATNAVIGSGIDRIYPRRNLRLAEEIVDKGGAIVSEFPLGTPPSAHNFPQRNRIISGLSLGTLVIEAALKSGSLITAKIAIEQNREVFAVPGSIHNPKSCGCNALIKEGAQLVVSAEDVVFALASSSAHCVTGITSVQKVEFDSWLLKCIEYDPLPLELLVQKSKRELGEVLAELTDLECKGLVAQCGGGFIRIA